MNPRIAFIDTERAPPIWWAWESNKPQFLNYGQLIQPGFFTSFQWMWEWEEKPSAISLADDEAYFRENPSCDKQIVIKALEIIDSADIVVAHNGKRFDWRHIRGRAIKHGLTPPKKPYIVDTLAEARKSAFPSNSLGALADHLDLARKEKNEAETSKLITGSMTERLEHIRKQTKYGLADLPPLKGIYYRLRPWMEKHPNMGAFTGVPCCTHCGSTDFWHKGKSILDGGNAMRLSYECKNPQCGKRFQGAIVMRGVYK